MTVADKGADKAESTAPAILCLTRGGAELAARLAEPLKAELHGRAGRVQGADVTFDDTIAHIRTLFAAGRPILGICASGILIRAVAPLLGDKRAEPPVLALAEDGTTCVPLLGGHRGANDLAARVAALTGGSAALTTAGEVALGVALDAPPPGIALGTPDLAQETMAALLAGEGARLTGEAMPGDWLSTLPAGRREIAVQLAPARPGVMTYHPRRVALGVGASRGCPPQELAELVRGLLAEAPCAPEALAGLFTIDLKSDEAAINHLARELGLEMRLFDAPALEARAGDLATPSDTVFAEVGCHGVAEGAALAGAGAGSRLWMPKRKTAHATAALALAEAPITDLPGARRGRLSVVGIGPGQAAWRTPEASRLIAEAEELVGYGLYIDLLGPLVAGKARSDFPLGGEEARCRYALERAGEGRNVALVCSGDAGIYAMGALVFELLDRAESAGGVSAAARRAEVICAPGISALQAAAARTGAPLGHDFCAISLSDLLTPRGDILRRVQAAAEGDFVIAFYNPVSRTRRTLLAEARDILLRHRPADTPVLLATSLGRPEESLRHRRLDALEVDEVDMLTTVVVGSSNSRLAMLGEGPRMFTPRGYARKIDGDLAPGRAAEGRS